MTQKRDGESIWTVNGDFEIYRCFRMGNSLHKLLPSILLFISISFSEFFPRFFALQHEISLSSSETFESTSIRAFDFFHRTLRVLKENCEWVELRLITCFLSRGAFTKIFFSALRRCSCGVMCSLFVSMMFHSRSYHMFTCCTSMGFQNDES